MFELLFKYPSIVFSKGDFVLLGAWPKWLLALLLVGAAALLSLAMYRKLPSATPLMRSWRAGVLLALQIALAALLLVLLWQPAMLVAQLKPQQNIIAVLVDDSRSMAITEDGSTRQAQAVKALDGGVLTALQNKFQTRVYRLDSKITPVSNLSQLPSSQPATHISQGLQQLADETTDLPIGAVVLLSDGGDNSGGIDRGTIAALRNRHIPVHTVGFGREHAAHDVQIEDAVVAPNAIASSRLSAVVRFSQRGYAGRKTILAVRDGNKVLTSREVTLAPDGEIQAETLLFNVGDAGAKSFQFSLDALPDEENHDNNAVTRIVNVSSDKRRVLYVEGEPRWEYKFIRRAEDDDKIVQMASMLRTTENKIYRQGISDPKDLADGFPTTAEELFQYQALIIGSVEAGYFTPAQQDLIKQFVDRRGGGLLLLGGRFALSDGGWETSNLVDLLPVALPNRKDTFHFDPANVDLTPTGADSIICRLAEDPVHNVESWKKLPTLMDYQEVGAPKPGAAVLAEMSTGGRKMPLLVTQNYGRGRTALLATSGTWHWQMDLPAGDRSHVDFWQQMVRWLVADTPGMVNATVSSPMLLDDGHVQISADVRDKSYLPVADAVVQAHIMGPDGVTATVDMTPDQNTPGVFHADWNAEKPGVYSAQITAGAGNDPLGGDAVTFQRMDGIAENFHTEQNRQLLESLAAQTGGRYWTPGDLPKLANEIPYSDAGITIREAKDLWNMPIVFLLILALPCSEWLLRRKWGTV
jgi:uncharacterized membrane protein